MDKAKQARLLALVMAGDPHDQEMLDLLDEMEKEKQAAYDSVKSIVVKEED